MCVLAVNDYIDYIEYRKAKTSNGGTSLLASRCLLAYRFCPAARSPQPQPQPWRCIYSVCPSKNVPPCISGQMGVMCYRYRYIPPSPRAAAGGRAAGDRRRMMSCVSAQNTGSAGGTQAQLSISISEALYRHCPSEFEFGARGARRQPAVVLVLASPPRSLKSQSPCAST
jgi:hypothetical protein